MEHRRTRDLYLPLAFAAFVGIAASGCAQGQAHITDAGMQKASMAESSGTVMVGGEAMYPDRDIVDNAVNSKDHETLVAAVKAAGLVGTLKTEGPFTVFAPTDAAFAELPDGAVATLLKPENKTQLQTVLTYHVVPGRLTADDLMAKIREGGGKARLKTASGGALVAEMNGPNNVVIVDDQGMVAHISTYDVIQSNGVIHVVDKVLLPG